MSLDFSLSRLYILQNFILSSECQVKTIRRNLSEHNLGLSQDKQLSLIGEDQVGRGIPDEEFAEKYTFRTPYLSRRSISLVRFVET